MAVAALILSLMVFIIIGLPISFSLGLSSIVYFIINPDFLIMMPQRIWAGANSSAMMALPLFCMAGMLMNYSGMTKRIIDFCSYLVKPFRGGLGEVNVIASMIFGGISGSSVSDTSALGSVLIPEMKKKGFSLDYSAGITVASSTIGMIIPPSIPMIMYSMISGASIGALFLAGLIPGVLIGLTQTLLANIASRKKNYPIEQGGVSCKGLIEKGKDGFLALLMPVVIVISVSFGIATASESAGVAILYAFILGILVYRELKIKDLKQMVKRTFISSSSVMIIIAYSLIFTWILAIEQVPHALGSFINGLEVNRIWILLLLDLLILIVGTFIDVSPALLLLCPILVPVMGALGVNELHFGTIIIVGLAIGLVTPPIGMCLNAAAKLSGLPITRIFRAASPFLICNVIILLLVTFIPEISLWLPNLIMGR